MGLAVTVLVVGLLAWYLQKPAEDATAAGVTPVEVSAPVTGTPPKVGEPAPAFAGADVRGEAVSLASLKGKPVWLSFNATWCASCRAEAPDIQEAYTAAEGSDLVVVAVYMGEDAATVRIYTDRLGMTFTHVPDPKTSVSAAYHVSGVPTHFFIDRSGVVRAAEVGILPRPRMDELIAQITG